MNSQIKKQIILIFSDFPLNSLEDRLVGRGGGQGATWLPQLALSWESCQDFEIHWAVFDKLAKNDLSFTYLNQTFHRIPYISMSASLLLRRWPHRLCASRLTRRIKPDLIHCWGTENLNGAALLGFKGPSILSMQGIVKTCLKSGDLNTWQWKLLRHYEPESIRLAKVVTCESQWGLDRVAEISPQKMTHRIEYGVFPSFYKIQWEPIIDSPRFLFVGGLNRLKGIDILIKMLRRNPKRNWKMVFVGDGYLMNSLKSLNDPSVEVLGMLKTEQVQQEMSKAWGLVMPSRADTSPNVVKEARVIGLPVVGSPNGGHAEYIDHGKDGMIVDSENSDAWFEAINMLAMNYELCREMGRHRHEHFRKYFRPERTADEFLNLYRSLL
jgi:glycosyltransferase involved in cell wall biosynthesis